MPRLLPPEPAFPPDNGAERTVWEALREQLPDDVLLFSGVGIQDGRDEREIDLLVAWPGVGLAVIEVKGGAISRVDGQWYQGSGVKRHRINPVRQVQDARHALQRYLKKQRLGAGQARFVHIVAFPAMTLDEAWHSPDLPREMLVGRHDLADIAERVRTAIEDHGAGFLPLDEADIEPLVHCLAAGLPSQLQVLATAADDEDRLDQLTRAQVHLLDNLAAFGRLQVVGGAGTGKTWLALEQARRRARAGDRVALLCYSRGLGRYLRRVTEQWPADERPAWVGLFHDLPLAWGAEPGADDDSDYWERELPVRLGELAAQRSPDELFDSVVVDEAQDFGELWWPSLLRCLRSPSTGGLWVFSDDEQRVFPRDGHVPIDLPPVMLDENLRSTRQIAQVCGSLREGITRPRGMEGAPVRIVDVPYDEAVHAADDAVDALLTEGWAPGSLALLTTGKRHPLQVDLVGAGGWDAYWDEFFAGSDVFYGHVLGFKGLERSVVVLAVNGFHDASRARKMLYTGLSRARLLLVVAGPRVEIEHIGGEAARRRLEAARGWVPGR
jgi:hypothetical protein